MALFPVTFRNYPDFYILYHLSYLRSGDIESSDLVDRMIVENASLRMANHP